MRAGQMVAEGPQGLLRPAGRRAAGARDLPEPQAFLVAKPAAPPGAVQGFAPQLRFPNALRNHKQDRGQAALFERWQSVFLVIGPAIVKGDQQRAIRQGGAVLASPQEVVEADDVIVFPEKVQTLLEQAGGNRPGGVRAAGARVVLWQHAMKHHDRELAPVAKAVIESQRTAPVQPEFSERA